MGHQRHVGTGLDRKRRQVLPLFLGQRRLPRRGGRHRRGRGRPPRGSLQRSHRPAAHQRYRIRAPAALRQARTHRRPAHRPVCIPRRRRPLLHVLRRLGTLHPGGAGRRLQVARTAARRQDVSRGHPRRLYRGAVYVQARRQVLLHVERGQLDQGQLLRKLRHLRLPVRPVQIKRPHPRGRRQARHRRRPSLGNQHPRHRRVLHRIPHAPRGRQRRQSPRDRHRPHGI